MYGVVFSFKDPFDTKDMRTTAGGDAAYDIDFPARDHILVEQLRDKGAIIFAKAVCTEYNGRAGNPGGRHKPDKVLPSTLGYQRSTWGGNPSNPYDTTRAASLGSSSGSGVSVSANLVMCSLGEETRASCRGPANHNAVALILPHKAMLGFDGGAIGADIYCDRSGILAPHDRRLRQGARRAEGPGQRLLRPARPLHDGAALVGAADALREPRGMPARRARSRACASASSASRCWCGPARQATEPIATAAAAEIKSVLGGKLGATLVEFGRSAVAARPRHRADEPRFPRGRWRGWCRCSCPTSCSGSAATASRCSRNSPPRSGRPSSCPASSSAPARWRRSTIASSWPKAGSRRPRTSTSPRSRTRSWR